MKEQIHKRLSNEQVKAILEKYYNREIKARQAQDLLDIKESQFFEWAKSYKKDPDHFSIEYKRKKAPRQINLKIEKTILREFKIERKLIQNPQYPLRFYNYSFIKNELKQKYKHEVSLPTIIDRAKKYGFYIPKKKKKKKHDREVITNFVGELIQHDSSHHLFSPFADKKWHLITSIEDYSRYLLFGDLVERETSWKHIEAAEYVCLTKGIPFRYYVDSHSIFRYVEKRDSVWRKHHLKENEAYIQWKEVLRDLKIDITHALSPQAKGKVERPYGWMQDHLVRICARENVKKITEGREIFRREMNQYNFHRVHSTTGEIPAIRFEKALKEKKTLFRPFKIPYPFESTKDIFCLRLKRTTNAYRKISLYGLELKIPVNPFEKVELRMVPNEKTGLTEIRFWHKDKLVYIQKIKNSDLRRDHF